MTLPGWLVSQQAVESRLLEGPATIAELMESAGRSRQTVLNALNRATVEPVQGTWPRQYRLLEPARWDDGEPVTIREVVKIMHIVDPAEIPADRAAGIWQEQKDGFGDAIKKIDLRNLSHTVARKHLAKAAATILGVYVALGETEDGPDWRENAGLDPVQTEE